MKALFRLLMLAALIAGVMAAVLGLGRYYAPLTVAHWRAQLDAVPDQSAEPLLRRVGSGGDVVIPILVEGLASPRERVAEAARQSLLEQIDRWKTLSTAGSSPKLALLARELADRQSELGPAGRHDAAELAVLILHGPLDPGTVDTVEVISCCEKVLRAAQADSPASVAAAVAKRMDRRCPVGGLAEHCRERRGPLAGHDQSGSPPQRGPDSPACCRRPAGSRRPTASRPAAGQEPCLRRKTVTAAQWGERPTPVNPTKGLAGGDGVRQVSAVEKLPAAPSDELKAADSFDLLQQSCSPVEQTAAAARAELSRRGFSEVHFDLARRLYQRRPGGPQGVGPRLPELRSVDAAPWLIQLSRDSRPRGASDGDHADGHQRRSAVVGAGASGLPATTAIRGFATRLSRIDQQRNDASQRGTDRPTHRAFR